MEKARKLLTRALTPQTFPARAMETQPRAARAPAPGCAAAWPAVLAVPRLRLPVPARAHVWAVCTDPETRERG